MKDMVLAQVGPRHLASYSASAHELCSVNLEGLMFLVTSIPFDSYKFSTPSSPMSPELREEKFDEDISFRTECFKVSHSLCNVQLWVSTSVPVCCRRKFSDDVSVRH